MAEFTFDFCTESRVAEKISPDEPEVKDFNGWIYHPTPVLPYRPSYKITIEGMQWYLNGTGDALDAVTDPEHNAGRLEAFYLTHRMHKPFDYVHEYLGTIELTFAEPLNIPKGMVNSGGAIEPIEFTALHHNVDYFS